MLSHSHLHLYGIYNYNPHSYKPLKTQHQRYKYTKADFCDRCNIEDNTSSMHRNISWTSDVYFYVWRSAVLLLMSIFHGYSCIITRSRPFSICQKKSYRATNLYVCIKQLFPIFLEKTHHSDHYRGRIGDPLTCARTCMCDGRAQVKTDESVKAHPIWDSFQHTLLYISVFLATYLWLVDGVFLHPRALEFRMGLKVEIVPMIGA